MSLTVTEILGRSQEGQSRPYICRCDDGDVYFVKGRSTTRYQLIAEWICAELCTALELPIAHYALATVPVEIIEADLTNAYQDLGSGAVFASRRVNAKNLMHSHIKRVPQSMRRDIILFDWWVHVGHNFANKEYQEKLLERDVSGWLRDAGLQNKFHAARIGNEEYHAHFPFVAGPEEHPEKIIKPLNLNYTDAAKIIDHGGQWLYRIDSLKKRGLLPPQVLFAVKGPESNEPTPRGRAQSEIVAELKAKNVIVVNHDSVAPILEFARAGVP